MPINWAKASRAIPRSHTRQQSLSPPSAAATSTSDTQIPEAQQSLTSPFSATPTATAPPRSVCGQTENTLQTQLQQAFPQEQGVSEPPPRMRYGRTFCMLLREMLDAANVGRALDWEHSLQTDQQVLLQVCSLPLLQARFLFFAFCHLIRCILICPSPYTECDIELQLPFQFSLFVST